MILPEKIRLFINTFQGRQDVVPRYWHSPRTGRSGYAPVCRNEWLRPFCRKGFVPSPCPQCPNADYAPLGPDLVYRHFKGEHILGIYALMPDHTCRFLAADFDNHDGRQNPLEDVRAFYDVCQFQEFPCAVFRSKSGKGYHAYLFFQAPVPAWKARCTGFAFLEEAEISYQLTGSSYQLVENRKQLPAGNFSSFDRLFPNQDRLSGRGFGNLIALPFQGKAAQCGHTLLLDPSSGFTRPYPDQWRQLARIEKVDESALDGLIESWKLVRKQEKENKPFHCHESLAANDTPSVSVMASAHSFKTAEFEPIALQCRFISHCREDAAILPEPDWYILLTIASRCRDGRRLSHQLSAPYPEYSYKETEAKITQALTRTGPYRCKTIERINPAYCKTCPHYNRITSPIRLGSRERLYPYPPIKYSGRQVFDIVGRYLKTEYTA